MAGHAVESRSLHVRSRARRQRRIQRRPEMQPRRRCDPTTRRGAGEPVRRPLRGIARPRCTDFSGCGSQVRGGRRALRTAWPATGAAMALEMVGIADGSLAGQRESLACGCSGAVAFSMGWRSCNPEASLDVASGGPDDHDRHHRLVAYHGSPSACTVPAMVRLPGLLRMVGQAHG
jgi:hypothetical protein